MKKKDEPCQMEIGKSYTFQFPEHPFHGVLSRMEQRHIHVTRLRDLFDDPLEISDMDLQPLLRRGRYYVTGYDFDRKDIRSFYTEPMKHIRADDLQALPKAVQARIKKLDSEFIEGIGQR